MEKQVYTAVKIHDRLIWLTRTAFLVALLIVSQAATAPLGSTLITGAVVNALLVISVMSCGLASGLCVAMISPVMAKLFGIGPQYWSLLPFIAAGNTVFVSLWQVITKKTKNRLAGSAAALITAAFFKFLVLYLGVSKLAVPFLLNLPEKQSEMISGMFAVPQLITALIGGVIALMLYSVIKIAIRSR